MRKFYWLIAFTSALFLSASGWAAETCEQNRFGFILDNTFTLGGDGEGMETHPCSESNYGHGDSLYKKVKALADAGKADEAKATVEKELEEADAQAEGGEDEYGRSIARQPDKAVCVRPSLEKGFLALMGNIAQQRADKAEKAGRLVDAIRIHDESCQFAEAARIHAARVKAAPLQGNGYSQGESEFKDAWAYSRAHPFDNLKKTLREVATSRADHFHKAEAKMFAPGMYQPEYLAREIEWLPYAGDDGSRKKAVMALAEQRGDALAKDEGCLNMASTLEYYRISGNQAKVKQATAKAMALSEDYEKKGAYPAAAKCYEAAGAKDKAAHAEELAGAEREQKAAEYEKKEKVRQKKFSKEQDDLEKELGF